MKTLRKYRRFKRRARRTGIAALLAAFIAIAGGCGLFATPDGEITEVEEGSNGVKIEYHADDLTADDEGESSREVYLRPGTTCAVGQLIQDCAEPGDLLIPNGLPGQTVFDDCAAADALNATPLHRDDPGWNPGLDGDRDGTACED